MLCVVPHVVTGYPELYTEKLEAVYEQNIRKENFSKYFKLNWPLQEGDELSNCTGRLLHDWRAPSFT